MHAYFTVVSLLLLVLSVVAFSDNLFTDVGQPSNRDPKFIVHGLFGLAWYILFATQANLVRIRNLRLHKAVGATTLLVAAGVSLSTLYLFIVKWKGWDDMEPVIRMNRLLLPAFATCIVLAWKLRTKPAVHKRLILVGTLFMIEPILSRAYDPLVADWAKVTLASVYTEQIDAIGFELFLWGTWIGLFVSLLIYDLRTQGRAHPVTAAGVVWLAFSVVVCTFL
ncbi:MAG: hypothetical protein NTW01_12680 [Gammaproteobacteria bacterium]|jgi:hypothetical protein|nr:hypothetical protein [Gammaproteobacteria bacterium]